MKIPSKIKYFRCVWVHGRVYTSDDIRVDTTTDYSPSLPILFQFGVGRDGVIRCDIFTGVLH